MANLKDILNTNTEVKGNSWKHLSHNSALIEINKPNSTKHVINVNRHGTVSITVYSLPDLKILKKESSKGKSSTVIKHVNDFFDYKFEREKK